MTTKRRGNADPSPALPKNVTTGIRLPRRLWMAIRRRALDESTTASALVKQLLEPHFKPK